MRLLALFPAIVAFLCVGRVYEVAGATGAALYVGIIVLSVAYTIRPMVVLWAPLFAAFVDYFISVAAHPPDNDSPGEWFSFILRGTLPALLLWFARPRKLKGGITSAFTKDS
jgi:hypothetical protein